MLRPSIPPSSASCMAAWSTRSLVNGARALGSVPRRCRHRLPFGSRPPLSGLTVALYTVQFVRRLYSVQSEDGTGAGNRSRQLRLAEVLQLGDIAKPEIADDEVLVRVHAACVHLGDWVLMTGSPFVVRFATACGSRRIQCRDGCRRDGRGRGQGCHGASTRRRGVRLVPTAPSPSTRPRTRPVHHEAGRSSPSSRRPPSACPPRPRSSCARPRQGPAPARRS